MSDKKSILVIDDEKNIRFTIKQSLANLDLDIEDAINGEEALQKIDEKEYKLLLLDLKMPGIDGMQVLRIAAEKWPDIKVIIITAYGTIDAAVEAMKLGAVDFLQKPFSPAEIRHLVEAVLFRDSMDSEAHDYNSFIELAKKSINGRRFDTAIAHVKNAINYDTSRPEAYNLLGVLMEIKNRRTEAEKNYRVALSLDPAYKPASANLHRIANLFPNNAINLGDEDLQENESKE